MHFSVLVVGENVGGQLQPFCELECSMDQDQIRQDPRSEFIEQFTTEELEKDFLRVKDESPEYYYEILEEFADEYHGISKLDDEEVWGRYTNPNSKWDWYSIGGRYTGRFKIKENPKYLDDIEIGEPGLLTESASTGHADSIRLCDIDFDGMKEEKIIKLEKNWIEANEKISKGDKTVYYIYGIKEGDTKETYIEEHTTFSVFATLKDGEWNEKGWEGEDENENWQEYLNNFITSLPDDTLLTIVDCHI